jgi:hypothetical protein
VSKTSGLSSIGTKPPNCSRCGSAASFFNTYVAAFSPARVLLRGEPPHSSELRSTWKHLLSWPLPAPLPV